MGNMVLRCGLLAWFALIRRLRRHLPPRRGRLLCRLLLPYREILIYGMYGVLFLRFAERIKAFPFEGEGVAEGDG